MDDDIKVFALRINDSVEGVVIGTVDHAKSQLEKVVDEFYDKNKYRYDEHPLKPKMTTGKEFMQKMVHFNYCEFDKPILGPGLVLATTSGKVLCTSPDINPAALPVMVMHGTVTGRMSGIESNILEIE